MCADSTLSWFERQTGYSFSDGDFLERALTHRSVANSNNERLEFLGDAVLDTVISHRLLLLRPEASEGELSRLRSSLVRDRTLAELARSMDIGTRINLGSGELKSGGYRRESILADAMEALLGAVFLDGGYAAVETVIDRLFAGRLDELPADEDLKDPKTRLQEWLQGRSIELPEYRVVQVAGKPHDQTFTVECEIEVMEILVSASGGSRRKAEQAAAALALTEVQR